MESTDTREDTDVLSLNFVKEELGVDRKPEGISCSHRVGKIIEAQAYHCSTF